MPPKLSIAQKDRQVTSFGNLLKASASTSLTRDQIKLIYQNDFKTKWTATSPEEPCAPVSELRFLLTRRGVLMKDKDDYYIVSHARQRRSSKGKPIYEMDEKQTQAKRTRRRNNNLTHLAVNQHIVQHRNIRKSPQPDIIAHASAQVNTLEVCNNGFMCRLCKVNVLSEAEAVKHVDGRKHRVQALMSNLKRNRGNLIQDKHDIKVTSTNLETNGNIRATITEGEKYTEVINLHNHSSTRNITFKRCELLKRVRVFQLQDAKGVTDGRSVLTLKPSESYQVKLTMLANYVGAFQAPIAFTFALEPARGDQHLSSSDDTNDFMIVRYLCVRCLDPLIEALQPSGPYIPAPATSTKLIDVEVIDGLPPPRNQSEHLEREIRLEWYPVPGYMRGLINRGMVDDKPGSNADIAKNRLKKGLKAENHQAHFADLLWAEEMQMEVDIRNYDMVGVTMERDKRLLILKVPGLAENRPSVMRGDCLYVRITDSAGKASGCEYRGHVHQVGQNQVYLGFSQKLLDRYVAKMKFKVRFEFNRLPMRVQHRAVELAAVTNLSKLLFPSETTACSRGVLNIDNIRYFDERVQNNIQQRKAVEQILNGSSRPAPYLIFGPPGTGKTVTMVEAIKQVVTQRKESHVLVCAPSNSAIDLLTERLLSHLDKRIISRIHAASQVWANVPEKVKKCSNYSHDTGEFCFPAKADLCKFQVIACTLITAGRLVSANFPAGHFTHVFIDEAGHALESEALVPIAGILECDLKSKAGTGQVVLAGDPKQLGPVIRSPNATKYGLGTSLLERLMTSCNIYQRQEVSASGDSVEKYNSNLLTKLVRNYRSHPAILHLSNKFFYHNELKVHADQMVRESLCQWEGLPTKGFPLLFHGTTAHEAREERSPSFFNPTEVSVVINYVQQLLEKRGPGMKLKDTDIGIISPYRKQVQKIQQALRMKKLSTKIKVGSVEEFQGQERHVIIISTVRTSPEYLAMDMEFKLGFLKNPKRFNVSLTRAKALLILVGNPYVLSKDEHWNALLEYCQEKGAYTGVDYEPEDERLEDILQRFSSLKLDVNNQSISLKESVEAPAWS